MRKITIAIFLLAFGVFTAAGPATAAKTTIMDAPFWEKNLDGPGGVLDTLYGLSNLTRIDDNFDQVWNPANGNAVAKAKYAAYSLQLGYIRDMNGFDTANFQDLFSVSDPHFDFLNDNDPSLTGNLAGGGNFVWALATGGATPTWTSMPSMNGGDDHIVTWLIGGNSDSAGNYVIAWEDDNNLGDQDYNDLVVEVSGVAPVPIPSAILLLGSGLVAMIGIRRRFKD